MTTPVPMVRVAASRIRTLSPTLSGNKFLVCPSCCSMWRCRRAISLKFKESLHVGWGWYFPGRIGIRSLIGRPYKHIAGESLVLGSGVFRYCKIAFWNWSTLISPVLPAMSRFMVLTPISVLQLLCGNATELRWWCTPCPQSWMNCLVF